MQTPSRPISPHLSVYKVTLTMTMSIVHRGTGLALYVGTILLVIWLAAAALGAGPLDVVHIAFASWIGQVILFLATWALFHHLLGGIRHFIWDTGHAFDHRGRELLARLNLAGSIILTLLAWAIFVWF